MIDALKKNPLLFFFGFAIWYLQLSLVEKINKEGVDNLQAKLEQKNQFELIVKNLEESLVIITDNKWQMANQQFLNNFRKIIISEKASSNDSEEPIALQAQDSNFRCFGSICGRFKRSS